MKISRRTAGLGAVAGVLGIAAAGYHHMFGGWYLPTAYDDLLHQIVDRGYAAQLGQALPHADVAPLAAKLRQPGFALSARARADAAAGRVTEAAGWVVPETVALYAQLAAGVER